MAFYLSYVKQGNAITLLIEQHQEDVEGHTWSTEDTAGSQLQTPGPIPTPLLQAPVGFCKIVSVKTLKVKIAPKGELKCNFSPLRNYRQTNQLTNHPIDRPTNGWT